MIIDFSFMFYLTHVTIDSVGICLMTWWICLLKRERRNVSIFYWCLLLMFLGGLISSGTSAYCRYWKLIDDMDHYKMVINAPYWHIRVLLNLIADGVVVVVMLHRAFILKTDR